GASQLDQAGALGDREEPPVLVPEPGESVPGTCLELCDVVQVLDRLEHRVSGETLVVEVRFVLRRGMRCPSGPGGEMGQVAETEPIPRAEQDPQEGGTVFGRMEDAHPGPQVGYLG